MFRRARALRKQNKPELLLVVEPVEKVADALVVRTEPHDQRHRHLAHEQAHLLQEDEPLKDSRYQLAHEQANFLRKVGRGARPTNSDKPDGFRRHNKNRCQRRIRLSTAPPEAHEYLLVYLFTN